MKLCKFCGETKDESLFHKDNRLKSGRSNICKACHNKKKVKKYKTDSAYHLKVNEDANSMYKKKQAEKGLEVKVHGINPTCKIIKEHHELMKDDPERMSTEFIQEIVGRKC